MAKPIFYDPQQKRWGRLRWLLNVLGITITTLVAFFIFTVVFRDERPGKLRLPLGPRQHLWALKEKDRAPKPKTKSAHRRTQKPPSQVVLNTDEGIRAAYYVIWDAASFVSLKEYYPQIDILFPEWLHVLTPDGNLQSPNEYNDLFRVIENGRVRSVDDKVMPFLKSEKAEVDVFPLINNYNPATKEWWTDVSKFL